MKKARAKRKSRKRATEGFAYYFHGGFAAKAPAVAKARKVGGWVTHRYTGRGGWRWVVQSERAPF